MCEPAAQGGLLEAAVMGASAGSLASTIAGAFGLLGLQLRASRLKKNARAKALQELEDEYALYTENSHPDDSQLALKKALTRCLGLFGNEADGVIQEFLDGLAKSYTYEKMFEFLRKNMTRLRPLLLV